MCQTVGTFVCPFFQVFDHFEGVTDLSVVIKTTPTKPKQSAKSNQQSEEIPEPPPIKKRTNEKKSAVSAKKATAATSDSDSQQCPICSASFPKDQIQVRQPLASYRCDVLS